MILIVFGASILLDLLVGDPNFSLHPVRMIGCLAKKVEKQAFRVIRVGDGTKRSVFIERFLGLLSLLLVLAFGIGIPAIIQFLVKGNPWIWGVFATFLTYFSFAIRDLMGQCLAVDSLLRKGNLKGARKKLSYLVTRDTELMEEKQVIQSTLETLSENILDSIFAPFLFFLLFGPLGAWGFRVINTLDSIWGYKNDQYENFGTFAARLDDLVCWIPARFSLIPLGLAAIFPPYQFKGMLRTVRTDRKKTDSPNSGWPESAAAGALGIQMGGPVSYFGEIKNKPVIGSGEVGTDSIRKMTRYLSISVFFACLLITIPMVLGLLFQGKVS